MSVTPGQLAASLAGRYRIERELGAGGMRTRQLPVTEAMAILRDVADALAYAQAQGIVHRGCRLRP